MADSLDSTRLSLRSPSNTRRTHGAWWPQNRTLNGQLTRLFDLWPRDQGRIARVWYSPPDWDDQPQSVQVAGRHVYTGSFPRDNTREMTLLLSDGTRRIIDVVPPGTSRRKAIKLLDAVAKSKPQNA